MLTTTVDSGRFLVIYSVKQFGISLLSVVCGTIVIAAPDLALGINIAINVCACFDSMGHQAYVYFAH